MLAKRKAEAFSGWDDQSLAKAWEDLMAEGNILMESGDRTSARAKELVRRWRAMTNLFAFGNPEIASKAADVWKQAMADPATAGKLPMNMGLMGFVQGIANDMRASGELK